MFDYFYRMNVAVNARVLVSQHMEGMARYIYETTRHMAIAHPDDNFYLMMDRNIDVTFDFPSNVRRVIIPLQARHPVLWRLWFDVYLPRYFRIHKIDVFYSGDGYCSLSTRIPTLLVIHDIAYVHFPEHVRGLARYDYRFFVPKYIAKAQHIITVSNFVKSDIIKYFAVSEEKITVAYNALDTTKIKNDDVGHTLPTQKPYFVYVGSLNPRKNIVRMIQAFELFNQSATVKHEFVIAGKLAWKSLAIKTKMAASTNVIYLGSVDEDTKYFLLRHAVAAMYCSLHEGFGIPIIEAYSQGTPVITSEVSSMPEVAGDGALCVHPERIEDMADAMLTITSDTDLRAAMISSGKKRINDFSWAQTAAIIYDKLNTIKK